MPYNCKHYRPHRFLLSRPNRPFRVPGGTIGALLIGVAPMLLLGFGIVRSQHEELLGMSSLNFGLLMMAAGVLAYGIKVLLTHPAPATPAASKTQAAI